MGVKVSAKMGMNWDTKKVDANVDANVDEIVDAKNT